MVINGVDTNFPLDPLTWFLRRLYVWSSNANAGADFSSSTAGLFFHSVQVIPSLLHFNLQIVQLFSLIFWFSLIIFGSFILGRILFPGRFLVQLLFVNLYAFNIYLFNTWENVKVANLSLMSAIPLGFSVLLLLRNKTLTYAKAGFLLCLIGLIISGAGINPAYIVSFFLLLGLYTFADVVCDFGYKKATVKIKNYLFVVTIILLVNMHWILPTLNFIFQNITSSGSIDKIGFTNWVQSLSADTSLVNVMRMQGAWDWYAFDSITGLPLYIPYALRFLADWRFVFFSFLITAIAISAFLVKKRSQNYLYLAFGLMFILSIFLGSGTHPPTGYLFGWMGRYIPFFSLFRSPWYIFTPLFVVSLAGLVSLFFYNIEEYIDRLGYSSKKVIGAMIILLILGNLVYSYPLVQGKIFRPDQSQNFYIQFPTYLFEAKNWLDTNNRGRVIGYPDDEIERFNWGYTGIDSILNLLVDNQSLFSPLNAPDAPIASIIKLFYLNLKRGEISSATALASKLNIGLIFEKKDQPSLSPGLPDIIKQWPSKNFGEWSFYQYPENSFLPKIFTASNIYLNYSKDSSALPLTILASRDITVDSGDSQLEGITEINEHKGNVLIAQNMQAEELSRFTSSPSLLANRLTVRDLSKGEFNFQLPASGAYQPVLEKYALEYFGLNTQKGIDVKLDDQSVHLEIDTENDSYIFFKELNLAAGNHKLVFSLVNSNLVKGDFEDSELMKYGEGEFAIISENNRRYLNILNKSDKDIGINFPIISFNPYITYLVQLRYHQIYGNNAQALISQRNQNALVKTQVERLPNHPEWTAVSFYYEPVRTSSDIVIKVVAPSTKDPLGTKVSYDDLQVYKVFQNNLLLIKKPMGVMSTPEVTFKEVSPVLYEGKVENSPTGHTLVFSENYSPNWDLSIEADNSGISKPIHFSTNLYANGWFVKNAPNGYKFRIYYKPQSLWVFGLTISLVTFGAMTAIFFKSFIKKR